MAVFKPRLIGMVMAGRCKSLGWDVGFSHSSLCGCCKPASGHRVRAESRTIPATNQGPVNQNWQVFLVLAHMDCHKMVVAAVAAAAVAAAWPLPLPLLLLLLCQWNICC